MQLADYLKELRKVKTLDHEEEQALWTAFKERGDEEARQRLIESYQPSSSRRRLSLSSTAPSTSSRRARSASSRRRSATTTRAAWPSACLPYTASAAA